MIGRIRIYALYDMMFVKSCSIWFSTNLADDRKARDIVVLDLRKLTNIADYFVICSGDSDTQTRAIADHIINVLKEAKEKYYHYEGYEMGSWVLIDYTNVVVHIFEDKTRQYYELERLWGDAEIIYGELPTPTRKRA